MKHEVLQDYLGFVDSQLENGNRLSPILWGATGVGKTQAVERFAQSIQAECITLHLASQDPGDLIGLPTRDEKSEVTKWLRPEWMPSFSDEGKYVIFLDEFNRANKYVLDVMLPFLLDGTIGSHRVPENTLIIAAANPGNTEDYSVTEIDDKAMLSRLCHVTLDASFSEWAKHVQEDVHPAMIEATRGTVKFDTCNIPYSVDPDPRSMHLAGIALKGMSEDQYKTFGWEFLFGMIGELASAVTTHIDTNGLGSGVKPEDILHNYQTVRPAVMESIESPDASNKMAQGVFDVLVERGADSLPVHWIENTEDFLLDLPEDVFMGFISRLNNSSDSEQIKLSLKLGTSKVVEKLSKCGGKASA